MIKKFDSFVSEAKKSIIDGFDDKIILHIWKDAKAKNLSDKEIVHSMAKVSGVGEKELAEFLDKNKDLLSESNEHIVLNENETNLLNSVITNINPLNENLRSVKVTYSNGDVIPTSLNGDLTDDEIYSYFKIGKVFNVGLGPKDNLAKVTKVEILK